ncbi:hypothetical protein CWO90_08355 [Bradyrhizobium sp. Leo121]|nr:hypothetical protein CWO90_08355 [Bradyrhizobium sp. Leo121]
MNRRLKNFILRRLAVLLVSWLPASSHSFGIESRDVAALRHVHQARLNSLAKQSMLLSLDTKCCSKAVLQRQYDRIVRLDANPVRITV